MDDHDFYGSAPEENFDEVDVEVCMNCGTYYDPSFRPTSNQLCLKCRRR